MITPTTMRDRCRDRHRAGHHHQHLHLLHVVGDAGDERRGTERADLASREVGDLVEQVGPQVPSEAHGDPGADAHGRHGEHDLDHGERQHERAAEPDVAGVAAQHALVDDVGVEAGQGEGGGGLDRLEHDDDPELALVGAQVGAEKADQHDGLPLTPWRNSMAT